MASPVHFQTPEFSIGKGISTMRPRIWMVGLGLAVVCGSSALAIAGGNAQEASLEGSKRKVRNEVAPVYPDLAKEMHLTGKVKIEAAISADGRVLSEKVIGGSPVLVNAALIALKEWRFEPAPGATTETFVFDFDRPE